jgi:hypothetical protein
MAEKLTILNYKIAIQLHLMAESCTICSSRSRGPVRKLLDTPACVHSASTWSWRGAQSKVQRQFYPYTFTIYILMKYYLFEIP